MRHALLSFLQSHIMPVFGDSECISLGSHKFGVAEEVAPMPGRTTSARGREVAGHQLLTFLPSCKLILSNLSRTPCSLNVAGALLYTTSRRLTPPSATSSFSSSQLRHVFRSVRKEDFNDLFEETPEEPREWHPHSIEIAEPAQKRDLVVCRERCFLGL